MYVRQLAQPLLNHGTVVLCLQIILSFRLILLIISKYNQKIQRHYCQDAIFFLNHTAFINNCQGTFKFVGIVCVRLQLGPFVVFIYSQKSNTFLDVKEFQIVPVFVSYWRNIFPSLLKLPFHN